MEQIQLSNLLLVELGALAESIPSDGRHVFIRTSISVVRILANYYNPAEEALCLDDTLIYRKSQSQDCQPNLRLLDTPEVSSKLVVFQQ
eukprot:SAG31_NODE_3856_length_3815_cov_3.607374_3_plen_89_part_00